MATRRSAVAAYGSSFDRQTRAFRLLNEFGYRPNGRMGRLRAAEAELVRDGGRLAMVVPAELLQVRYAAE